MRTFSDFGENLPRSAVYRVWLDGVEVPVYTCRAQLSIQEMHVILFGRACRHAPIAIPANVGLGPVARDGIAHHKDLQRGILVAHIRNDRGHVHHLIGGIHRIVFNIDHKISLPIA